MSRDDIQVEIQFLGSTRQGSGAREPHVACGCHIGLHLLSSQMCLSLSAPAPGLGFFLSHLEHCMASPLSLSLPLQPKEPLRSKSDLGRSLTGSLH